MVVSSWTSPKTVRGKPSKIHELGFFALEPIKAGELLSVKGGHIINKAAVERYKSVIRGSELQLDEDLFLASLTEEELAASMVYCNHSCEPNGVMRGDITFVAWRDIAAGEELTFDYATMHDSGFENFICNCGSKDCRGKVTSEDWKNPQIRKKYGDHFSPYLLQKIRADEATRQQS